MSYNQLGYNLSTTSKPFSGATGSAFFDPHMPNPTEEDIKSELFESIWKVIKTWDINVPEYYNGYCVANGSHVKLLMNAIRPTLRNIKIDEILK